MKYLILTIAFSLTLSAQSAPFWIVTQTGADPNVTLESVDTVYFVGSSVVCTTAVGSNSNRFLLATAFVWSGFTIADAPTDNAVPMVLVDSIQHSGSGSWQYSYGTVAPDVGDNIVTYTFDGTSTGYLVVYSLYNVDQTTPVSSVAYSTPTWTETTGETITGGAAGNLCVDMWLGGNQVITGLYADESQTVYVAAMSLWDVGFNLDLGISSKSGSADNVVFVWEWDGYNEVFGTAFDVKKAP